jgi:hypothetical protein
MWMARLPGNHRISKKSELETGWVGKWLGWARHDRAELGEHRAELGKGRAELVEGWVGGTCEKM